jgi:hypothetical protein
MRAILAILLLGLAAPAWPTDAQLYCSPVVIDHTKVPADQTSFPVLFSVTDARFKTVGNSGHVNNANGYDLIPYSNSTCTTRLHFSRESYSATTGAVLAWIQMSVSHTADATYYWGAGDTGITTDQQDSTNVWTAFAGVWHLGETSGTTVADATGNGHTGTKDGASNPAPYSSGKIGGAQNFASGDKIALASQWALGTVHTFSFWLYHTGGYYSESCGPRSTGSETYMKVNFNPDQGNPMKYQANYGVETVGTGLTRGAWHFYWVHRNGADVSFGEDATVLASASNSSGNFGADLLAKAIGYVDELHTSTSDLGDNWLITEYNNQNSPSTFSTLGTEASLASSAAARRRMLNEY